MNQGKIGASEVILTGKNKDMRVGVLPNYGGALNRIEVWKKGRYWNLIDGYDDVATFQKQRFKGVCLAPFPNRIKDGRYKVNDQVYELAHNDKFKHAMHGFVFDQPMEYRSTETSIHLTYQYDGSIPGYPFPFEIYIDYHLEHNTLEQTINIENKGKEVMPFGLGWHPYFSDLGTGVDHLILELSNARKVEVNERKIPTGEMTTFNRFAKPTAIGDLEVDHCFVIESNEDKVMTLQYPQQECALSLSIKDNQSKYIQLYILKERNAIAIEPMTCIPDAFNNGIGLQWLPPQSHYQWTCVWEIQTI